jgi:dTDP-4-dehydrorhamnose reductase
VIKLLITGAEGQLGQSFQAALDGRKDFIACAYNKAELDITDAGAVEAAIIKDRPDFLLNAAAYTLVALIPVSLHWPALFHRLWPLGSTRYGLI